MLRPGSQLLRGHHGLSHERREQAEAKAGECQSAGDGRQAHPFTGLHSADAAHEESHAASDAESHAAPDDSTAHGPSQVHVRADRPLSDVGRRHERTVPAREAAELVLLRIQLG